LGGLEGIQLVIVLSTYIYILFIAREDCIAIKTDLDFIRKKVIKRLTGHEPPYLSHAFKME
jgi:hypothetical protein